MNAMTEESFERKRIRLRNAGYEVYHQPDDARVVENECSCSEYSSFDMTYAGFRKQDKSLRGYSYRAFAICDNCEHWEEF